MEKIILNVVVMFFLNVLSTWNETMDWSALEAKLDDHINRFFPVKALDKTMIALAHFMFFTIKSILSEEQKLALLLSYVEAGDWKSAAKELELMIVSAIPALRSII